MFREFREFAVKGNVVDMAVGIIIGAAFGSIVTSFVADIIMPPIGLLMGNVDFANIFVLLKDGKIPGPYETLAGAKTAGAVTMNVGTFINTVISFIIVGFSVFMIIRTINRLKREQEKPAAAPTTRACPFCLLDVPVGAVRCGHCTSEIK